MEQYYYPIPDGWQGWPVGQPMTGQRTLLSTEKRDGCVPVTVDFGWYEDQHLVLVTRTA